MKIRASISSAIYSYLPFSDDRVQFLDIRGWDGQATKLNREFYLEFIRNGLGSQLGLNEEQNKDISNEIIGRTENVDGIYILLGEDVDNIKDGIAYIGETGDFRRRMMQYFASTQSTSTQGDAINNEDEIISTKEFCSEIFFFSQRGKLGGAGLGESLRKEIEAKIIQEALISDRYRVVNATQNYNGKLNLSEKDVLYEFFDRIKIILEHLGNSLFKEKIEVKIEDTKNYFICTENNTDAIMYRGETGFVVLEGSIILRENAAHLERKYGLIYKKRENLIETGILKPSNMDNNIVELTQDQEFKSSSSAAIFVLGRSVNGYTVWRKKDNPVLTYGEFLQIEENSGDNNY